MSILDALKKLVVAFGGADNPDQVSGNNIADVVETLSEVVTPSPEPEEFPLIKNEYIVGKKGSTATVGKVCSITANNKFSDCNNNNVVCGVIAKVVDNEVTVQFGGFVTVSYTGSAPTVGYTILVADGQGGVKTAQSGPTYFVRSVDSTNQTVTFSL